MAGAGREGEPRRVRVRASERAKKSRSQNKKAPHPNAFLPPVRPHGGARPPGRPGPPARPGQPGVPQVVSGGVGSAAAGGERPGEQGEGERGAPPPIDGCS